jgi:hypothetical protein
LVRITALELKVLKDFFKYTLLIHHRVCNKSNMMAATRGAGTAYPFGAHEFTPGF